MCDMSHNGCSECEESHCPQTTASVCARAVISSYLRWISFGSVISVAPRQFAVKSEFPLGKEINKTISALEKPLHFIGERGKQMRMFPMSD